FSGSNGLIHFRGIESFTKSSAATTRPHQPSDAAATAIAATAAFKDDVIPPAVILRNINDLFRSDAPAKAKLRPGPYYRLFRAPHHDERYRHDRGFGHSGPRHTDLRRQRRGVSGPEALGLFQPRRRFAGAPRGG